MKQKTGKEKHTNTHTHNTWILACLLRFRMDGQSESISTMRASKGKNGMVREAGELMKLTKKQEHQYIHSEGGGR